MASNNKKKKNVSTKEILVLVFSILVIVGMVALLIIGGSGTCLSEGETRNENTATATTQDENAEEQTQQTMPETAENVKTYDEIPEGHPVVTVEMENGKTFKMELYPEFAPQTVANFVALAESGFYDGVVFHRIVEGFMAQGGDPEGTGMGGADYNIVGEFADNGFDANTLSHTRGVVSMARSNMPDSASSQFFICYDDASFLDGQYAAFGKVIEGMETVDGFLEVERTMNSMGEEATPVEPVVMKTVTVER